MLRLEEARKQKGWNQAELAKRVGLSQVAIWKFESGKANPSFETLIKLANVLECQIDDLVVREPAS